MQSAEDGNRKKWAPECAFLGDLCGASSLCLGRVWHGVWGPCVSLSPHKESVWSSGRRADCAFCVPVLDFDPRLRSLPVFLPITPGTRTHTGGEFFGTFWRVHSFFLTKTVGGI